VTGPLPFLPAEIRGTTVEWTSSLSRPELETFYRARHPGWIPSSLATSPPSLGPIPLPGTFLLRRVTDGALASIVIGMPNPIDSGTLVAVTIVPGRPAPTP